MRYFRFVFIKAFIILSVAIILIPALAYSLPPVPPDVEVEKPPQTLQIGPSLNTTQRFITSFSKNKLIGFYRKTLAQEGWVELRELYFKRGNEYLTLILLPESRKNKGKTRFAISYGNHPTKEQMESTRKDKPDQLRFMPIYPSSEQMFLWDTPTGIMSGYRTEASAKEVSFFYQAKMLNYGWSLAKDPAVSSKSLSAPLFPARNDGVSLSGGGGQKEVVVLEFVKGKKEVCHIRIEGYNIEGIKAKVPEAECKECKGSPATGVGTEALSTPGTKSTVIAVTYNNYENRI